MSILVREVVKAAAKVTGIRADVICGEVQTKDVVRTRHIVMFVAHDLCGHSSSAVGRILNRDHTTVLNGARKIASLLTDDAINHDVARVLKIAEELAEQRRREPVTPVTFFQSSPLSNKTTQTT